MCVFCCLQPPDSQTSIKDLAQLALPGVNLDSISPPPGLPGLENVFVDRLSLDVPKKTLCVEARVAGATLDIIPGALQLDDIAFGLCLNKTGRVVHRQLDIMGTITIGSVSVVTMLDNSNNALSITAAIPQSLAVPDLLSAFSASFIPGGDGLANTLKQNGFDAFGLEDIIMKAEKPQGSAGSVSIVATAILPGFTSDVQLLFTGLGSSSKKAVAVFSTPTILISKVVDLVSGIDISGIPVLGDLSVPGTTITVASDSNIPLPRGFAFVSPLVKGTKVTKGIAANFLRQIGGAARNFKLSFRPGSFDIDLESLPSLKEAIESLLPDIADSDAYKALPDLVAGVANLRVTRIAYDSSTGKFSLEVKLSSVNIIPDLLEISTAKLVGSYTKPPRDGSTTLTPAQRKARTAIAINGQVDFFGLKLDIIISFDQTRKAFNIRITSPADTLRFQKLFDILGSGANDLTNPAISALRLRESEVRNPLFEVNAQSKSVAFRIRGTPTISGFGVFTAEVIANTKPRQFILTMSAREFSISKLIEIVTGLDLSGIPFLGLLAGPSSVGVTLSATNVPRIPFPILSYPLNETTSIDRGLGFTVAFRLPEDCAGDPICNFVQLLLGNQAIIFRVTGINGPQATLAYRLPAKLSLGAFKLYNVDFGFTLSATRPPTVGLTNIELDLPVPFAEPGQKPLHFRGKMLIDPTLNVEASLEMTGIYLNAFKIPVLSFGNVDAAFRTRIDCPICVTQLRLGGEVAIGRNCYDGNQENCVIARAVFNIDAVDVKNNYYFFAVNQLSYRLLLRAIGMPDIPPLALLDAVSMRGVEASYSSIDRNIPFGVSPGMKTIKAGMVLKGEFSVLFFANVKVDVAIELQFGVPKSINALVEVDPINLGPIRFTAASDVRKGAKFELKANLVPTPSFFFSLDGSLQISLIGFRASVNARVDETGLRVVTSGPIYGFQASFTLTAQFENIRDPRTFTNFKIAGRFEGGLIQGIFNGLRDALNAASRNLKRNLDALVAAAERAQRALNSVVGELNLKKRIEKDRRVAFDNARNALNSAQNTVNRLCRIQNCDSHQNVPKPCVKQSCSCSIKYPCCSRWRCSTCCRTICVPYPSTCGYHRVPFQDPACLAANAACLPVRETALLALEGAKLTLRGAEEAVKAAEKATAAATKAFEDANVLANAANAAVAPIRALFNEMTSALNRLWGGFVIHSITFSVQVQSLTDAKISVGIDLSVFGSRHKFNVTLDLRKVAEYGASLARRFFSQFSRFF